jgi:hypothetical protein
LTIKIKNDSFYHQQQQRYFEKQLYQYDENVQTMPPSISQFTTHPRCLPSGSSKDCNEVGFSPGKSPPTALIRIENDQQTNNNCSSSIYDNNYHPDNSFQTLSRNIASPSIKNSKPLRFMPYMKPDVEKQKNTEQDNNQDFALFGPVPSAESLSFSSYFATSGSVTPPTSCVDDLTDHILDDEMVFQELESITNPLNLPFSPPLSPIITTTTTTTTITSSLDDDFNNDDFILFH